MSLYTLEMRAFWLKLLVVIVFMSLAIPSSAKCGSALSGKAQTCAAVRLRVTSCSEANEKNSEMVRDKAREWSEEIKKLGPNGKRWTHYEGFILNAKELNRLMVPCEANSAGKVETFAVPSSKTPMHYVVEDCSAFKKGKIIERLERGICCDLEPPRGLQCLLKIPNLTPLPAHATAAMRKLTDPERTVK